MITCVTRLAYRLCLLAALLCLITSSLQAQGGSTASSRWVWKTVARKNKPQKQFTLVIYREGDAVRGVYSVDEFVNGEWQGEDGNQTAFSGRVTGKSARIEFDPSATVPGYEENVTYKAPADGRKPSVAVVTFNGKTVLWRFVSGDRIEGVPARLVLRKERSPK